MFHPSEWNVICFMLCERLLPGSWLSSFAGYLQASWVIEREGLHLACSCWVMTVNAMVAKTHFCLKGKPEDLNFRWVLILFSLLMVASHVLAASWCFRTMCLDRLLSQT